MSLHLVLETEKSKRKCNFQKTFIMKVLRDVSDMIDPLLTYTLVNEMLALRRKSMRKSKEEKV